ncbi:MAG TPA: ABC transporter permease, partial [Chitinophagaceae bacterium]|nr:ABC transporter permease [Chitinophagaceae bacterium]
MIKNLFLVAIRNFRRDKWYSLLNILGLTIGIAFSLFLIFYIKDELSYDRYNEKADRIYRVNANIKEPDKDTMRWAVTPFPMGPALSKDYPEVEEAVRFISNGKTLYKNGELRLYEDKVFFADSNLFRVFTYRFIEGNPQMALVAPNSMVLTNSVAEKFFGKDKPYVGKTLENANGDVYKITAVIGDVPRNSHIRFNIVISRSSLPADFANNWGGFGFYTYVLLKPNTSATSFEKKLLPVYDKYLASIFSQFNIRMRFSVQPITSIHLHSEMNNEPEELGSTSYIYIFSAVAFFMLLIACINYMNLTTARSARRSKEIGIRKVTGSSQLQLIAQFLIESTLAAVFSLLLSIAAIALLLPTFNSLSGKFISFNTLLESRTILIMLAVVIFAGLV